MNNKLFRYLVGAGIFKNNPKSARRLVKTERRRRERQRRGLFVWISKAYRETPDGSVKVEGKGTFRGNVKQDLF